MTTDAYREADLRAQPPKLRLRRLEWIGYSRYQTLEGRFEIAQGGNGAGSWTIFPSAASRMQRHDDNIVLIVAEADRAFNTLREAREWLAGSVYAKPDGWLHQRRGVINAEYRRMVREPMAR